MEQNVSQPAAIADAATVVAAEPPLAARALEAFTGAVTTSLKDGDSVALVGFGTFSVKERAARTGRNPQTGDEIQIAAANIPSFKAGKGLKDQVNP